MEISLLIRLFQKICLGHYSNVHVFTRQLLKGFYLFWIKSYFRKKFSKSGLKHLFKSRSNNRTVGTVLNGNFKIDFFLNENFHLLLDKVNNLENYPPVSLELGNYSLKRISGENRSMRSCLEMPKNS